MKFINQVKYLPDGIRGLIFSYLPRHDLANIIKDAIINNNLNLKYVRSRKFPNKGSKALPNGWTLASSPGDLLRSNDIIVWHLNELRPTRLISDTYGNGVIKRTKISIGEQVRLRAIKKGSIIIGYDSKHNIKLIRNNDII
tara:strand:+ start:1209 stop:1631 length:423 start_codon:yes stop_codon:yes gene_type:complete